MGAIASGGRPEVREDPAFPCLVDSRAHTALPVLPTPRDWIRGEGGLGPAGLLELCADLGGTSRRPAHELITGSLTLLMLTLVSVFFVWVLILLGVELTHVLQTKLRRRKRGILSGAAKAGRAENAIRMLVRLAGGGPVRFRDLYKDQEASSVEAEKILDCLRERYRK